MRSWTIQCMLSWGCQTIMTLTLSRRHQDPISRTNQVRAQDCLIRPSTRSSCLFWIASCSTFQQNNQQGQQIDKERLQSLKAVVFNKMIYGSNQPTSNLSIDRLHSTKTKTQNIWYTTKRSRTVLTLIRSKGAHQLRLSWRHTNLERKARTLKDKLIKKRINSTFHLEEATGSPFPRKGRSWKEIDPKSKEITYLSQTMTTWKNKQSETKMTRRRRWSRDRITSNQVQPVVIPWSLGCWVSMPLLGQSLTSSGISWVQAIRSHTSISSSQSSSRCPRSRESTLSNSDQPCWKLTSQKAESLFCQNPGRICKGYKGLQVLRGWREQSALRPEMREIRKWTESSCQRWAAKVSKRKALTMRWVGCCRDQSTRMKWRNWWRQWRWRRVKATNINRLRRYTWTKKKNRLNRSDILQIHHLKNSCCSASLADILASKSRFSIRFNKSNAVSGSLLYFIFLLLNFGNNRENLVDFFSRLGADSDVGVPAHWNILNRHSISLELLNITCPS